MAHIDFNLTKDAAGAITAATVDFRVDLTGFPATSAITAAHIHTGAAGVMRTRSRQRGRGAGPGHLDRRRRDILAPQHRRPPRPTPRRSSTTRPASTSTSTRRRTRAASSAVNWCQSRAGAFMSRISTGIVVRGRVVPRSWRPGPRRPAAGSGVGERDQKPGSGHREVDRRGPEAVSAVLQGLSRR